MQYPVSLRETKIRRLFLLKAAGAAAFCFLLFYLAYQHLHVQNGLPIEKAHTESKGRNTNPYANIDTGSPEPQYRRTLVIAKMKEEDTSWIESELSDILEPEEPLATAVYITDDKKAPLSVPVNKGHEAMVYLTYIIDQYETLPDFSIFMHSHSATWHNNDLLDASSESIVRHLSSEKVLREGYMNLRCHWEPGCPNWIHPKLDHFDDHKEEEQIFFKAFQELFPTDVVPEILAQPCCAQFAVSKENILRHGKERYIAWRNWIANTDIDSAMSGRVFEYIWQYLFTSYPIHCPNMHICYCDAYSICFEDEHEYVVYTDIQDTWRAFNDEFGIQLDPERKEWLQRNVDDLKGEMERRKERAVEAGRDRGKKYGILERAWDELLVHPPGHLAEKYGHFGVDSRISP